MQPGQVLLLRALGREAALTGERKRERQRGLSGLRGTGMPSAKPASMSVAQPGCLCPLEQMHPPWRGHSGPCPPLPGHSAGTACSLLTRTTCVDGTGTLSKKSQSQEDSLSTAFSERQTLRWGWERGECGFQRAAVAYLVYGGDDPKLSVGGSCRLSCDSGEMNKVNCKREGCIF